MNKNTMVRLEETVTKIEHALEAAYCGSPEDGSFFRRDVRGEYVPSVFVTLSELKQTIENLKKEMEPKKIGESLGLSGNIVCVPRK